MKSLAHRILRKLCWMALERGRVQFYRLLSRNSPAEDRALRHQATLINGVGKVRLGLCHLGVSASPYFLTGSIYIEARLATAEVHIADGVWLNNNAVIIAERSRIAVGENTLIGTEFTVFDSDFHDLHLDRRLDGAPKTAHVLIGKNVFIGSRVTVLKGVIIGDNSVIASGSVVVKSLPANCIAGGVPAEVIRFFGAAEGCDC